MRRGGADHRRLHAPPLPNRAARLVLGGGQRPRRGAPHPRAYARRIVRQAGPGDRHAFRRRDGRSYRPRRGCVPAGGVTAGGVTALPAPFPIGVHVFGATALFGLRLWMWPLSVPAVGSITALISAGLPDASASTRSEERRVGKECRSRWSPY